MPDLVRDVCSDPHTDYDTQEQPEHTVCQPVTQFSNEIPSADVFTLTISRVPVNLVQRAFEFIEHGISRFEVCSEGNESQDSEDSEP